MEFNEMIRQFSKRIEVLKNTITTEEGTKMSLIVPLFQMLGYDVFNPMEFCPEYTADVGIKKGEKVDYAILEDGNPSILIECKSCTENLKKHSSQLFRYFGTTTAKFGILTNGMVYQFYTDLESPNKMDLVPFLTIDLENAKESQINQLKKFCKENFNKDEIFSTAEELKYTQLIKNILMEEFDAPSEGFVRHIMTCLKSAKAYDGQITQKILDKFNPLAKKAYQSLINEIVNNKISSALTPEEPAKVDETHIVAEPPKEEPIEPQSKIVTTEEEIEAFYIIRGILVETCDVRDVIRRDTESYFGILFQDNNRKPICRLKLDGKTKSILIPDENKVFTKYTLETLNDIYNFKIQLQEAVKRYL
ncbi:MAG: endonuclease [Ruminococcaceae bacterium]|nr:endonuclease [Oscillospiraceae bacterium]